WDLLWACNVAMPLLAFGCFLAHARMCVCAFLFLLYGTPMWLLDLVAGGGMVLTSPLLHLGGLGLAAYAVWRLGWPPRTWLVAAGGAALVLAISALVTPPAANVNMAFSVYKGWEHWFPSHRVYLAGMWLGAASVFFVAERIARKRR